LLAEQEQLIMNKIAKKRRQYMAITLIRKAKGE